MTNRDRYDTNEKLHEQYDRDGELLRPGGERRQHRNKHHANRYECGNLKHFLCSKYGDKR